MFQFGGMNMQYKGYDWVLTEQNPMYSDRGQNVEQSGVRKWNV